MLFNSYTFIFFFLPVVLALWWGLRDTRLRLLALTVSSYFFYAWWDWRFLPVMMLATGIDYFAGGRIAKSREPESRKRWLVFSLTANLALLGFFKYFDFAAASLNSLTRYIGAPSIPVLGITLPIGISFYTFNSMSYTIDLYRGTVARARSFLHYSAFVSMFPHLIAGPIVRFADVEQQLTQLKERLSWMWTGQGLYFFIIGLSKKIIIADRLAPVANQFFADSQGASALSAWIAVIAYSMQLYFDFSGYSDMSVGLALMLGIRFPQNFDSPYQAVNISDFWRRWHITLSNWLRDYLFIPLGGSAGSTARTAINLALTMFLGGLWHGAQWTFVVWGLYHGCLLALHRTFRNLGGEVRAAWLARLLTFLGVTVGWVFFRADNLSQAGGVLLSLAGMNGWTGPVPSGRHLALLAVALLITQFAPNSFELELRPKRRYAYALAVLFVVALMLLGRTSPFLYFQF